MIYPELKNYLTNISSIETVDLFDNAIVVFDKYDVPDYMGIFDNTINNNSEQAAEVILDYLLSDLTLLLKHILSIQGVTLNENAVISQMTEICNSLFELPYYLDKIIIENLLSSDENDTIKFCQLINLLAPYSIEEILNVLDDLNEDFISNFKTQIKSVDTETANLSLIKLHVDAYIRYKDIILKNQAGYCDKFFMNMSSIGLPYEEYVKQYQNDNKEHLNDVDSTFVNHIAQDLVGLTTLSCDGINNPLLVIRKYLGEIYPDINTTTKVDIAVSKIVLAYTQ